MRHAPQLFQNESRQSVGFAPVTIQCIGLQVHGSQYVIEGRTRFKYKCLLVELGVALFFGIKFIVDFTHDFFHDIF